jgi:hypothetical protein
LETTAHANLDNDFPALLKSAALKSSDTPEREETDPLDSQDSIAQDDFTNPERVERRVWHNTFAVVLLGIIVAAILADRRFTFGLVVGSLLSLVNYKWLHTSVKDVLSETTGKAPPGTAMLFVIRWIVIGLVIYFLNLTGWFDPRGMLAGLFAPALAVMIEAGYVTYKTITQRGE